MRSNDVVDLWILKKIVYNSREFLKFPHYLLHLLKNSHVALSFSIYPCIVRKLLNADFAAGITVGK